MEAKKLVLTCRYSVEEQTIAQILQNSFDIFLKKELQNVANPPFFTV